MQKITLVSPDPTLRKQVSQVCKESDIFLLVYSDDMPAGKSIKGQLLLDVRSKKDFVNYAELRTQYPDLLLITDAEYLEVLLAADILKNVAYLKYPVTNLELQAFFQRDDPNSDRHAGHANSSVKPKNDRFGKMIGISYKMLRVYELIKKAAASDIPVLIIGETGTGKDMVAQEIHLRSSRSEAAYVPVNLGSIPQQLVASELFGHQKGAFTGAIDTYRGRFEQANKGTIFLDEIDSIDEKVQISLLRMIEQKRFSRLGGKNTIHADVRVLTATNSDIEDLIEGSDFRNDLFYRLDVFRINLPPLRERAIDIEILARHFMGVFNASHKKAVSEIDAETMKLLSAYHWPGNVRELKNVMQRGILLAEENTILPQHLPPRFRNDDNNQRLIKFEVGTPLIDVEREMVLRALAATNNNRTEAARLLGISRRAIYNKLKKHDI